MDRSQKRLCVESFSEDLKKYPVILVMKQSGLDVAGSRKFRAELRQIHATYRVMKNTLAKLSAQNIQFQSDTKTFEAFFTGPVGVVCAQEPSVAKTVLEFCKANGKISCVGGFWEKETILDPSQLAKIPALPGMQAKLLSALNSGASSLVRLLGAYRDKLEAQSA